MIAKATNSQMAKAVSLVECATARAVSLVLLDLTTRLRESGDLMAAEIVLDEAEMWSAKAHEAAGLEG